MEKENNTDESDFSENEIPDLNFLKPFEFEPKKNIGDINSSSSDERSKQCKLMKTYTESLCCRERNDIPERYYY